MKKTSQIILTFAAGIILAIVWLNLINIKEVARHIKEVNILLAISSLVFFVAGYFIRSLRWKCILKPVKQIKAGTAFNIYMAGNLVNFIVPVRLGELAKSIFLKKAEGLAVRKSLPTIIIDKVSDLLPIIPILAGVLLVGIHFNRLLWTISLSILALFLALLASFIVAHRYHKAMTWISMKICFWLPTKLKATLEQFFLGFYSGFSTVTRRQILQVIGLTIAAVVFDTAYFYLMFASFGHTIGFFTVLVGYTLFVLTFVLPTPPAQVGSSEIVQLLIFSTVFGIDRNLVSAVTLLSHFLTGIIIIAFGSYAMLRLNIKWNWLSTQ